MRDEIFSTACGRGIRFVPLNGMPRHEKTVRAAQSEMNGPKPTARWRLPFCAVRQAGESRSLPGAAKGSYLGDVATPLPSVDHTVEVMCRSPGFAQLYNWLEDRDLLVVKSDRREMLVVLPMRLAVEIAQAAEKAKNDE